MHLQALSSKQVSLPAFPKESLIFLLPNSQLGIALDVVTAVISL